MPPFLSSLSYGTQATFSFPRSLLSFHYRLHPTEAWNSKPSVIADENKEVPFCSLGFLPFLIHSPALFQILMEHLPMLVLIFFQAPSLAVRWDMRIVVLCKIWVGETHGLPGQPTKSLCPVFHSLSPAAPFLEKPQVQWATAASKRVVPKCHPGSFALVRNKSH